MPVSLCCPASTSLRCGAARCMCCLHGVCICVGGAARVCARCTVAGARVRRVVHPAVQRSHACALCRSCVVYCSQGRPLIHEGNCPAVPLHTGHLACLPKVCMCCLRGMHPWCVCVSAWYPYMLAHRVRGLLRCLTACSMGPLCVRCYHCCCWYLDQASREGSCC